ncbi:MAG: hypothetical protein H7323_11775 [Frankiales bacterium]|nr:hypothetical protein [Frankiales bacterium]
MSTSLVLAVLAHADRPCLQDQLANLRAFAPDARVVVFNGGTDRELTAGLDVATCPYSRPLTHHRVGSFHGLVMQWLVEQRWDADVLVTLDSDMLLLKPGLGDHAAATMAATGRGYLGAHFGEVLPDTAWRPGRRFHRKWAGQWQELFGLPHPYRAFNPGQAFSGAYVEAFAAWSRRPALMAAIERTRLDALDEIVWATLAVALGVGALDHPGGRALQLRRHSPQELGAYLADPDVFMVHRVGMDLDAADRRLLRAVAQGQQLNVDEPFSYDTSTAAASPVRRAAARLKDAYQAVAPAAGPGSRGKRPVEESGR